MILRTVNKQLIMAMPIAAWLFLFSGECQAQLTIDWNRTYGGNGYEEMNTAIATTDGGYLYGGITTSRTPAFEVTTHTVDTVDFPDPEPTGDYWMLKTDADGNVLWDKRFGGKLQDRLWSIVQTPDGGYLLGGDSRSGVGGDRTWPKRGETDFWVVKLDANGNMQWDRAYGGTGHDFLRKIVLLPNGQYWLTGTSDSPASFEKSTASHNGSMDFWAVKIDENGLPLGDYTFGGSGKEELFDAMLALDGNILMVGPSESPADFDKTALNFGFNDMWVVKASPMGLKLWDASFGGNGRESCQRIRATKDGNYVVTGETSSDKLSGNKTAEHYGSEDIWLVKFADQPTGAVKLWDRSFGGQSSDIGYDICETSIGNLLLFGESASASDSIGKDAPLLGGKDFWFLFLHADGEKQWEESLGGTANDGGRFAFVGHDYGYLMAGLSNSNSYGPYKDQDNRGPSWSNDLYVIRTGCAFPPPQLEDLPKTCPNEEINLDASIPLPCHYCQYFWEDGATGPERTVSPDTTTQYTVTVVHPDGCERSDSMTIEIVPGPSGYLAGGEPISCYGETDALFYLEEVMGGTPPYQFSFEGSEWEATASYFDLGPGFYTLEIQDANGCLLDTTFYITQPEEVLVELGPDLVVDYGDSIQLQALTNLLDSFSVEWGQPDLVSCPNCQETWAQPFATTTLSIVVKDKNGCTASDNLTLIVEKSDAVFIPNAFSPNLDNINDFFTVYADPSVRRIKALRVFDRWGQLMYENYDFPPNKEQIGWNGKRQDQWLDPAVFSYFAEVEFVDSRVELFEGDVTLVK